jgi:hypothetical protein
MNSKKPPCVSGTLERPAAISVSVRQARVERKRSKKWGAYFAQSRKPPEVNDRKMNTGTFLPEWRGPVERKLRLMILRRKPGFSVLTEKARDKEKRARYAKIKG